jgi:hypothetical protein
MECGFYYHPLTVDVHPHLPLSHHRADMNSRIYRCPRSQGTILCCYGSPLRTSKMHDLRATAATPFFRCERQGAHAAADWKLARSGKGHGVSLRWREARCDVEKLLQGRYENLSHFELQGHETSPFITRVLLMADDARHGCSCSQTVPISRDSNETCVMSSNLTCSGCS